ncbi:DUF4123 domain-containing protein [Achromobacter sp. NPDC058515]|uniref:DUF4123 domain-containing protein n=1 Tax=Achromobacter sp. NPDC058515 TaxID=3346533 RepID=UPI00364B5372
MTMLASSTFPYPDCSRRVVEEIAAPEWPALQQGPRPWLWLNGAHNENLEAEVRAITRRFDHQWVWRGTDLEYQHPGYRRGPMLVQLDDALLEQFLFGWGPQAGVILRVGDHGPELLGHLQRLHQLIAADGLPVSFSLGAARHLEELCEALPAIRLAELLGPIQALVWRGPEDQGAQWLQARNAHAPAPSLAPDRYFTLTASEESALDHASKAWFMRDSVRHFSRRDPRWGGPANQLELSRQLTTFAEEAERIAVGLERDVRHYMALRLAYPQAPFMMDAVLRMHLSQHQVAGLQRMYALEDRLRQTVDANAPGSAT